MTGLFVFLLHEGSSIKPELKRETEASLFIALFHIYRSNVTCPTFLVSGSVEHRSLYVMM